MDEKSGIPQEPYNPAYGGQQAPPPYPGPQYPPQQQPYGQPKYNNPAYTTAPVAQAMYHTAAPMIGVLGPPAMQNPPDDYLFFNIFSCMCLPCWPLAIPAIFKSIRARDAIQRNDRAMAEREAKTAKQLGIASVVLGLIIVVVIVVASVVSWYLTVKEVTDTVSLVSGQKFNGDDDDT